MSKSKKIDYNEHENPFSGLGDNFPPKPIRSLSKFEIFKGMNGQFYFHLRAGNGEIILQSEGYKSKRNALKGIAAIRKNASAPIFELKTTTKSIPLNDEID